MTEINFKVRAVLVIFFILADVSYSTKSNELGSTRKFTEFNHREGVAKKSLLWNEQQLLSIRKYPLPQAHQSFKLAKREIGNDLHQLSKNISHLLDKLLKNYNKHIRPGLHEGITTVVRMNLLIRSMGPINEKDMQYSMDCYLRQEWRDDRLRFQGSMPKLSLNIKMLEALWKPDTYFRNGLESYIHTITRPNKLFRIDQEGKILYSMRLTIKAKCPMELRNFPMDVQSCPLLIGSFAYPATDVVYEWDEKQVAFSSGMALSQFDLLSTGCKNFTIRTKKETGYFLIQVYIPCILIVVLSWVSFWINREATSDRIGLGITTVLTLSTISLDTRTDLPKVHYATALDWFILMSFGYCIATLLQFAGVHYFTKVGSGEVLSEEDITVMEDIDDQDISGLPLSVVMNQMASTTMTMANTPLHRHRRKYQCDVFIMNEAEEYEEENQPEELIDPSMFIAPPPPPLPQQKRSRETQTEKRDTFCTQLFHCMLGNDEYRRSRQKLASQTGSVNSVSVIDSISRILFPASYGLLNLWYWYSYLSEQDGNKNG